MFFFFFFKQKTAYEMRISDWSSDVCSSDLAASFALVLTAIYAIKPGAMSYFGLNLMLQYAVPIAFATVAQMFILTVTDIDLSTGAFVGLFACVAGDCLVADRLLFQVGTESCRENVCTSASLSVVPVTLHKKNIHKIK